MSTQYVTQEQLNGFYRQVLQEAELAVVRHQLMLDQAIVSLRAIEARIGVGQQPPATPEPATSNGEAPVSTEGASDH